MTTKTDIIAALRIFICQRPGLEPRNYADAASYRQDSRQATRDRDIALRLVRDIELRDSITAQDLLATDGRRLTVAVVNGVVRVEYCAGQYWGMEFRAVAARYLASVLWTWNRDHCLPAPTGTADGIERYHGLRAGDYLRVIFRKEYGRSIANRFFT